MRTDKFDVTTSWQVIAANATQASIQIGSNGPIYLHVGASEPGESSASWILQTGEMKAISLFDLEITDNIYVSCRDAGEFLTCIHDGSAS